MQCLEAGIDLCLPGLCLSASCFMTDFSYLVLGIDSSGREEEEETKREKDKERWKERREEGRKGGKKKNRN